MKTEKLKTTGEVAIELGVPRYVVEYAIERHQISETQRVGILRVYNLNAIEKIKQAVKRTAGKEFQNGSIF